MEHNNNNKNTQKLFYLWHIAGKSECDKDAQVIQLEFNFRKSIKGSVRQCVRADRIHP